MEPQDGLTIDLDALEANFQTLKSLAGGAALTPAVKANGYGLGAAAVARRLADAGAAGFFVARLTEGEQLRSVVPNAEIRVLDGLAPGAAERMKAARLTPVLNSMDQLAAWAAEGGGAPAVLHVDTGINRLGIRPEQAPAAAKIARLNIEVVMSHLACADEPDHPMNADQLAAFREATAFFPNAQRSLANSAGIFLGADYHFDQVRPGISVYGGGPRGVDHPDIRPVATLQAPILQVREVPAGESVGYSATFTAKATTRVALIGAGYADGVLRSLSGRGAVWFDGAQRPYLGRVSMDMLAVDLGDAGAREGDLVEVLGTHITVDRAAAAAVTNAYEILTRLGTRAEHRYRGGIESNQPR
jgi:alanine racemase